MHNWRLTRLSPSYHRLALCVYFLKDQLPGCGSWPLLYRCAIQKQTSEESEAILMADVKVISQM